MIWIPFPCTEHIKVSHRLEKATEFFGWFQKLDGLRRNEEIQVKNKQEDCKKAVPPALRGGLCRSGGLDANVFLA